MKNKIGFLDSRLGSDTEVWRNEIRAYESQHIDWTRFTEDDAFLKSVLKIPKRWNELKEEYLRTNLTREQYIERCRRNKESLERFLKEHVINRAQDKPAYLYEVNRWKLSALIKYIQTFIDDYSKEIERESKLLPQEEPIQFVKCVDHGYMTRKGSQYIALVSFPKILIFFKKEGLPYKASLFINRVLQKDDTPYTDGIIQQFIKENPSL